MRNLQTVITGILALIPEPPPAEVADNMTVLTAELRIMVRAADYTPPESQLADDQWARLEAVLYRYMPPVTFAPWCQQISNLVTGS